MSKLRKLVVYTDGGSRGNPGEAAIGVVFVVDNKVIQTIKQTVGFTTNNKAEYLALVGALDWLMNNQEILSGIDLVEFRLDSKLVVEQINRRWKIKDSSLLSLANKVWKLLANLNLKHQLIHVSRNQNKLADSLVNQALDSKEG